MLWLFLTLNHTVVGFFLKHWLIVRSHCLGHVPGYYRTASLTSWSFYWFPGNLRVTMWNCRVQFTYQTHMRGNAMSSQVLGLTCLKKHNNPVFSLNYIDQMYHCFKVDIFKIFPLLSSNLKIQYNVYFFTPPWSLAGINGEDCKPPKAPVLHTLSL